MVVIYNNHALGAVLWFLQAMTLSGFIHSWEVGQVRPDFDGHVTQNTAL